MSARSLTHLLAPRRNVRRSACVLLRRLTDAGYEIRPVIGDLTEKDIEDWACVQVYIADAVPTVAVTAGLGDRCGGARVSREAAVHALVEAALQAAEAVYPRGVALVRADALQVAPAHVEGVFTPVSRCP